MFYRHFSAVMSAHHGDGECERGRLRPDLDMAQRGQASRSCRFVLMLSASFRAAFSIRKFLRNELRRSLSRAARRIGPLAAEGARGHGMDDPLVGMAKAPLKTLIEVCKKSV